MVSSGQQVEDLIPPGVRHLHLPGKPTIGGTRNAGCAAARGEVICFFDDDDSSHPRRLEDQVRRLRESGKAVTGYRSMRFTDGRNWWLYTGTHNYALGTSLCFRRDWWAARPFPDIQVGEDYGFVVKARRESQIVSVDAGEMMWATVWNGNTSPRQLNTAQWRKIA